MIESGEFSVIVTNGITEVDFDLGRDATVTFETGPALLDVTVNVRTSAGHETRFRTHRSRGLRRAMRQLQTTRQPPRCAFPRYAIACPAGSMPSQRSTPPALRTPPVPGSSGLASPCGPHAPPRSRAARSQAPHWAGPGRLPSLAPHFPPPIPRPLWPVPLFLV